MTSSRASQHCCNAPESAATPRRSSATARRDGSITSMSTMPANTDDPTEDRPPLRRSAAFDETVIAEIQRAADQGIYDIRGFGTLRRLPNFDDLILLGASMSRY